MGVGRGGMALPRNLTEARARSRLPKSSLECGLRSRSGDAAPGVIPGIRGLLGGSESRQIRRRHTLSWQIYELREHGRSIAREHVDSSQRWTSRPAHPFDARFTIERSDPDTYDANGRAPPKRVDHA